MRLFEGTVVWPAIEGKPRNVWLWDRKHDLFWIAGGGSLLFGLLATPISVAFPAASGALVTAFLHLAVLCNFPHYAATYQLIVRERQRARSSYVWLVASTPIALAVVGAGIAWPVTIGPVVRLYLTWSVYHYAAQHFGIASMYQARSGAALAPREKRTLQVGFIASCMHLMIVLNMQNGLGSGSAFGVRGGDAAVGVLLPASAYPLAAAAALIGIVAYVLAERMHFVRTEKGFALPARMLFVAHLFWFVVPFARLPGASGPWMGSTVATWLPFALPFFHCAQYLGVTFWRARTTGSVKPIYLFMVLVFLGLALFEGITAVVPKLSTLADAEASLLVPAVLNVHHFFLDGLMWRARRRPTTARSAGDAPASAAERVVRVAATER